MHKKSLGTLANPTSRRTDPTFSSCTPANGTERAKALMRFARLHTLVQTEATASPTAGAAAAAPVAPVSIIDIVARAEAEGLAATSLTPKRNAFAVSNVRYARQFWGWYVNYSDSSLIAHRFRFSPRTPPLFLTPF